MRNINVALIIPDELAFTYHVLEEAFKLFGLPHMLLHLIQLLLQLLELLHLLVDLLLLELFFLLQVFDLGFGAPSL